MDKDTMYTLGMICRAIWPGKGYKKSQNQPPPQTIFDTVLTRPASGLAMMLKHKYNTPEKQEAVADLVVKLGEISDPPGGVSAEDQGPFWLGYYHYAAALDYAVKYGPDQLRRAGEALYGERWQSDLSRTLGLSDVRRVRQWLAGERKIPVGVWADICALLRQRQISISSMLKDFEVGASTHA